MTSNIVLYISDVAVDLNPGTVVALTRQVNDIAELKNRSSDYSNAFKIPASAKNKAVFNGAQVVESVTREPYRKLPAKLVMNGAETIGVIVLMSANSKEFNCVFYAGNFNFFSIIQGRKIKDLDLSFAEHTWTYANVIASRINEWNDGGYVYPFVDTVNDGVNFSNAFSAAEWRWLTPWIFVKTIWNQIFLEAGFDYAGKFLNSVRFENLLTNLVTNKPQLNDIQFEIRTGLTPGAIQPFPFNAGVEQNSNQLRFLQLVADTNSQVHTLVVGNVDPNVLSFRPNFPGKYSFELNVNVISAYFDKIRRFDVCIYDATNPGTLLLRVVKTFTRGTDFNLPVFTKQIENLELTPNECVAVRMIFFTLTPATHHDQFFIQGSTALKLTNSEYEHVFTGLTWKIQENLYDMEQTEFIKQICQRFCLIPDTETVFNRVEFYQFGELIENIPLAKDWSDKTLNGTSIEFHDNTYAQNNLMKWNRPEELPDSVLNYGHGEFTIDDQTLNLEKIILELKFKASVMVKRFNSRFIPHIQFHDEEAPVVGEWNDVGARMLTLDRSDDHGDVAMVDLTTGTITNISTNIPMCYFESGASPTDLTFANAFENDYYDLIRVLKNYKKLSESIHLKSSEVISHKFKIPIYLRKYNSYFAILQISNFVEGKPVTLQLLKLN